MKVALQGRAQGTQKELYEAAGIDIVEGGCRTEDEMIELIGDADGAQVGIMPLTTRRVMESCPKLKVVSRFGVGVDSIDIEAATELGVMVCNVPGSNTTEVADHAMSLMLSLTRRIYDAVRTTPEGAWADNPRAIGEYAGSIRRLAGHTVGIVGFGNIGRAFATRIRGFGVSRILAYDPYVNQLAADLYGVTLVDFDTLVAEADCISVHCSATDESKYLFNADTFRRMKPTALLVNTARGPIVDGEALADALESGEIEAAALGRDGSGAAAVRQPPAAHPQLLHHAAHRRHLGGVPQRNGGDAGGEHHPHPHRRKAARVGEPGGDQDRGDHAAHESGTVGWHSGLLDGFAGVGQRAVSAPSPRRRPG